MKTKCATARLLVPLVGLFLLTLPATAEAQYFGRNKVQYEHFDFKVLRTDHFDVYFYQDEREAADIASRMADWPAETVFVTYCAGPHCNGAARGALRLARLGRPVKIMAGGITGWLDEGFELAAAPAEAAG